MSKPFETAQEEIRNALVDEYLKQNPGVSKQEVIMACKDGKLIFSDLATFLAEMKITKGFSQSLENARSLFENLAIHENQRWKECCLSIEYSKLMLDCLVSSPFNYYDKVGWKRERDHLENQMRLGAKATVKLSTYKEQIIALRKNTDSIRTPSTRSVVIEYHNWVIYQLKILHQVYKKEVDLGDIFSDCASNFITVTFEEIRRKAVPFNLNVDEINTIYAVLKGNANANLGLDGIVELTANLLHRTRMALTQAVEEMKERIEKRRAQFEEIWKAISSMQEFVNKMDELNRLDAAGTQPPPVEDHTLKKKSVRMARMDSKSSRRK
ncbi:MAG: hypothetical protein C4527_16480 [Candidatus Omnitrophota bacterium]|jgi:hypothetical protein|nr:MAG: hypothetical protein C4527_16480 [Candidatus Omnitrophota bacterium]